MSIKDKKILVLGVTGSQGGAVARSLLADGYTNVHGLVRSDNSDSTAVKALTEAGVKLEQGDLDDAASIKAAMQGVYGVFSVIPLDQQNIEIETTRGTTVADAAKQAGVQHFVYSSVGGAERNSGVGHFETKHKIEQHIQELGLSASIVRPVALMENFVTSMRPQPDGDSALFRWAIKPDTKVQFVASADIAIVVTDMFNNPDKFVGKAIEVAGDELTGPQIAAAYQKVMGMPAHFAEQPIGEIRAFSADLADMFTWFNDHGYQADIESLRQNYPKLMTLESWLRNNKDKITPVKSW